MNERIGPNGRIIPPARKKGMSAQKLRIWGILFLGMGILGQSIIQNRMLQINDITTEQLLAAMQDSTTMTYATVALVAQVLQACAIPIFSFLLVLGCVKTASFPKYFLRVSAVAVLSEIPYNLAMSGHWLDLGSRNPVVGLVLAMVLIFFYKHYAAMSVKGIAISALVIVVAIFWVEMLRIADGAAIVIIVSYLWATRNKRGLQIYGGCVVMFLCCVMSPLYLAAPMAFILLHFYNGEQGEGSRTVNYLAYPALLLTIWLAGIALL